MLEFCIHRLTSAAMIDIQSCTIPRPVQRHNCPHVNHVTGLLLLSTQVLAAGALRLLRRTQQYM